MCLFMEVTDTLTIYGRPLVTRFQTLGGGAHGVFGIRSVTRFLRHSLLITHLALEQTYILELRYLCARSCVLSFVHGNPPSIAMQQL